MSVRNYGRFKGVIILDPGHGYDTPGKRSPIWSDGSQLFEWKFNRRVCILLANNLRQLGYDAEITTVSGLDSPLWERREHANSVYKRKPDSFMISVHANAGGGTGWECFTSPGHDESDALASFLAYHAEKVWGKNWKMRFSHETDSEEISDPDKEAHFAILKADCPVVLTENFFMDTERDCRYIMSEKGVIDVVEMHLAAILDYINDKIS